MGGRLEWGGVGVGGVEWEGWSGGGWSGRGGGGRVGGWLYQCQPFSSIPISVFEGYMGAKNLICRCKPIMPMFDIICHLK